ncbi:MAG TPA: hypothetical protein VFW54_09820 [Propionibacteriaceae bacterium]|nr:hypothetical protein [Propionibacteriaceae bacterium]
MSVEILDLVIIVALIIGWRITWLATRVDRANVRAERTWAALDAALVRRAQRALERVLVTGSDPATALLVSDAAKAALEPDLSRHDREHAESYLSHVLDAVPMLPGSSSGLEAECARASICRRLHNDAVATALSLRRRRTVRILKLAGRAVEPRPFEMADGAVCALAAGPPDWPQSSLAYPHPIVSAAEPRAPAIGETGQPA